VAEIDAGWAFDRYQEIRPDAPRAVFGSAPKHAANLEDLAENFDAFILDAFGVLNRGESAIPGAVARMAELRAMGKRLIVLTNAASDTRAQSVAKYTRLGFDFSADEVISSRDVAFAGLPDLPGGQHWAAISAEGDRFPDAPVPVMSLLDDPDCHARAGGFLFLSSARWGQAENARLIAALNEHPRPLIVANPDLVAPRDTGLTLEPGAYAQQISLATGVIPQFFGKPHGNAFDAALASLAGIDRARIAMVGDTLHTDILGGAAAGLSTVLITDHGLFKGRDVRPYIARSGIIPNWIIPTT
jgi:HAD superfamily hydrolase (TIGR01459 family)